jgi:hypothetical protein
MAGDRGKQKKVQIARRRAQVADLYLRQKSQTEIAAELGVTQQTISLDIKAIQEGWQTSAITSFTEAKFRELARIDTLEREYWASWEASKEDKETHTTEKTAPTERPGVNKGARLKVQVRKQERTGDPRYLNGVQWCIDKRCQIIGLEAPLKQLTFNKDVSKMSDEELLKELGNYGLA